MFFDTLVYFIFLSIVVTIYWRLGWRRQNAFLLVASYMFYGWWDWRFLGLIFISTAVDFLCAHYIESSSNDSQRKLALIISVTLNLGFLGYFKYCNFFIDSFALVLEQMGMSVSINTLQIVLPPGISFYTFQALAYIVDVYFRSRTTVRRSRQAVESKVFCMLLLRKGECSSSIPRPNQFVKCMSA